MSRETCIEIEALGIVEVGQCIPGNFANLVIGTAGRLETQRTGHVWRLIIAGVIAQLRGELVTVAHIAHTGHHLEIVNLRLDIDVPRQTGVTLDNRLTGSLTLGHVIKLGSLVKSLNIEGGHTLNRKVVVLVGIDQTERKMLL